MRERRFLERLAAFTLAALLLLATGKEAFGVHLCPHHDRLPVDPAEAAGQADAGHHHGHHGQAVGRRDARPTDPGSHGTGCSCLGSCQASGGVALPVAGAVRADLPGGAVTAVPSRERGGVRVRLLPHVLPYANAPPQAC